MRIQALLPVPAVTAITSTSAPPEEFVTNAGLGGAEWLTQP
jgi:hypothetical protein